MILITAEHQEAGVGNLLLDKQDFFSLFFLITLVSSTTKNCTGGRGSEAWRRSSAMCIFNRQTRANGFLQTCGGGMCRRGCVSCVMTCLCKGDGVACIYKGFILFFKWRGSEKCSCMRLKQWRAEQMNWMAEEQFGIFKKDKKNTTWHCDATMWPYDAS